MGESKCPYCGVWSGSLGEMAERWLPTLDLVIVGAETGPNARYCPRERIESIVEQCKAAGVPVWVKAVHIPVIHLGMRKFYIEQRFNELPESVRVRQLPFREK